MKLLSLSAQNHRSFLDEFTLDFTRPELVTNLPPDGQRWSSYLYPAVAIYGSNASGKSNILKALKFIQVAIHSSAGAWLDRHEMTHDPFRLNRESRSGISRYSIDFVLANHKEGRNQETRYQYSFSVSSNGIEEEQLKTFLSKKSTSLIDRSIDSGKARVKLHRSLGSSITVSQRELVLSRALKIKHPVLSEVAQGILSGLSAFDESDDERQFRIAMTMKEISDGSSITLSDLSDLARAADTGITRVDIDEQEVPAHVVETMRKIEAIIRDHENSSKIDSEGRDASKEEVEEDLSAEETEARRKQIARALRFTHESTEGSDPESFSLEDESTGTAAWLSLAVPIVKALQNGSLIAVDELDTSLHPHLAAEVVRLFQDPETNPRGAQLLFTTHDISIIGNANDLALEPGQIWFTEKDSRGASELFSASDFPELRAKSNIAKQYQEGRLGAVPSLIPGLISQIVDRNSRRGQE